MKKQTNGKEARLIKASKLLKNLKIMKSEDIELINFLEQRSKAHNFDYKMFVQKAADTGFLGFFDCSRILTHLIIDYSLTVLEHRDEYLEERTIEILTTLKDLLEAIEAGENYNLYN